MGYRDELEAAQARIELLAEQLRGVTGPGSDLALELAEARRECARLASEVASLMERVQQAEAARMKAEADASVARHELGANRAIAEAERRRHETLMEHERALHESILEAERHQAKLELEFARSHEEALRGVVAAERDGSTKGPAGPPAEKRLGYRPKLEEPMALYSCEKCGMSVGTMTCGKCGKELVHDGITKDDGTKVHIAKCPEGHGKVKSPMCCGQDMSCPI